MRSYYLNGIKIYAPSSRSEIIKEAINTQKILIAVNAIKIVKSKNQTKEIINKNLGYPDGIGAVFALKRIANYNAIKIPGCELWLDIVKKFYKQKTFYLIGGEKDVISKTTKILKDSFPGIKILQSRHGYIRSSDEKNKLLKNIKSLAPDIVFVAMGSPKQELIMHEMHEKHKATYVGLGGSFDIYIGKLKRAPQWWIKNNIEWLYRLFKEPKRIKSQLILIYFAYKLLIRRL